MSNSAQVVIDEWAVIRPVRKELLGEDKRSNVCPRRVWGFCAHSRKYRLDDRSLCWQKRQQDSAEHKE